MDRFRLAQMEITDDRRKTRFDSDILPLFCAYHSSIVLGAG